MLENALKQIEQEKAAIEAAASVTEEDEEAKMFDYDNGPVLNNSDFSDFKDF
jgi:hypothetical protein